MIPLAPLEKDREPKPRSFAVCDIETAHWTRFVIIGYYDGKKVWHFKRRMKFLAHVLTLEKDQTIYAHFGGRFDFLFILEEALILPQVKVENIIPRGSSILCFDLVRVDEDGNEERRIRFSDSSAFLPFRLRKLCESFKVEHLKLEIDYTKIKRATRKLKRYLNHDLKGHYEVIEKYFSWPLIQKSGPRNTIASQAVQVLRGFLPRKVYSCSDSVDAFVREAYFGGRTEIFKPFYGGGENPLYCYDVNSLYPTVMRENKFPARFWGKTTRYDGEAMGFYDAEVEVPKGMYVPPLGVMHEISGTEKLVFPTGRFRGRWSTIELEYAKSVGVKVLKTFDGYLFRSGGYLFRDFIDELYRIRLKAKEDGDGVSDILSKLLMNSCYGRFGLAREQEKIVIDEGQEGVEPYQTIQTELGPVRLALESETLEHSFSNVAVAAWVTSLSRIKMHRFYRECEGELYYTDTDSLFTTRRFPETKGLGGLKLEYQGTRACFLLPKTYLVDGLTGNTPESPTKKIVMKGFDRKKIARFELEDFVTALEGELRVLKTVSEPRFATFKTALQKGKLVTMTERQSREIRTQYDKRTLVRRKGLYDTLPLHLKLA